MKLYLVKMTGREDPEVFYKVGITKFRDWMHRFTKYGDASRRIHTGSRSRMEKLKAAFGGQIFEHPYEVSLVLEVEFEDEVVAEALEQEILRTVEGSSYLPKTYFSGHTECFTADASQIALLVEAITGEAADARAATAHKED